MHGGIGPSTIEVNGFEGVPTGSAWGLFILPGLLMWLRAVTVPPAHPRCRLRPRNLELGGHESLCFPQVSENKALPFLSPKRCRVLTI